MASPVPQKVVDGVTNAKTVMVSAETLINGIGTMVANAVQQALANGATAAELQPVSDVVDTLNAESTSLAAAVQANTPTP